MMMSHEQAKVIALKKLNDDFGDELVEGDKFILPDEYSSQVDDGWKMLFTTKKYDEIDGFMNYSFLVRVIMVYKDGKTDYPPSQKLYNVD